MEGWGEGGKGGGRSFNSLTVLFDLMVNFPGAFSYGDRKAALGEIKEFQESEAKGCRGGISLCLAVPGDGFPRGEGFLLAIIECIS